MKCPICNRINPKDNIYCAQCGTKLEDSPSIILCPNCLSKIPLDSNFCPDCGKPIKGTSEGDSSDCGSVADTLEFTVGDVRFKMIHVEGGTFKMGATPEMKRPFNDEHPVHDVTLSSYFIGETPVTQALWKAIMGSNPSYFKGHNLPVECVSWNDCQEFIQKLNSETCGKFRCRPNPRMQNALVSKQTRHRGSTLSARS